VDIKEAACLFNTLLEEMSALAKAAGFFCRRLAQLPHRVVK
jgi:hypothetical protein